MPAYLQALWPLKLLKMQVLFNYARAHAKIYRVLKGLQSPYCQAHGSYDQTHASYVEAHARKILASVCNRLNHKSLPVLLEHGEAFIWNGLWFG